MSSNGWGSEGIEHLDEKKKKLCSLMEKRCDAIENENCMLAHRLREARRLVRQGRADRELLLSELRRHRVDVSLGSVPLALLSDQEDGEGLLFQQQVDRRSVGV